MTKVLTLPQAQAATGFLRDAAYNALDTTGTLEIANVLLPRLNARQERIYRLEKALQGPAMAMTRRGIRVNRLKLAETLTGLKKELTATEKKLVAHPDITAVWDRYEKVTGACAAPSRKDGKHKWEPGVADGPERKCLDCGAARMTIAPFNPGSPDQKKHLLYDLWGLKKQRNKEGEVTADDEALVRLAKMAPKRAPVIELIRDMQDLKKQHGDLSARLTPDYRFPSVFNVGAAWTGRWSSSKDPKGRGRNLQNVAERHRAVFEADPGMLMFYADLKQAESNMVAHLAGDEKYIEAHMLGDVHTYVTRMVWPELGWTGDLKADKKIAKQLPPWDPVEGHDYRFQSKRIQHGSNYGLSPFGIAMIAKIPLEQAKRAQAMYFRAFPGIPAWHGHVAALVRDQQPLINPIGREIKLFGRPWDERTVKQGLAFLPQSAVADIINIGVWRVWRELEIDAKLLEVLAQVHDALLGQVREDVAEETVRRVMELMKIPVPVTDIHGVTRVAEIETEAAIGRNWGHASDTNPDGIKEI